MCKCHSLSSKKQKCTYKYEATHMWGNKTAGFAGYFDTKEEAEALRRHSQLPVRIKRVYLPK